MKSRRRLQDWHHLLIIGLIIVFMTTGLAFLFFHFNFIGSPSSVERDYIDRFVKILFSVAGLFFSTVIVVIGYSLIFFRRRPGDDSDGAPIRGYPRLEQVWTVVPLIIVISLAVYGGFVLNRMTAPGPPADRNGDRCPGLPVRLAVHLSRL